MATLGIAENTNHNTLTEVLHDIVDLNENKRYKQRNASKDSISNGGSAEINIIDSELNNNIYTVPTPIGASRNYPMEPHPKELQQCTSPKFASPRQSSTATSKKKQKSKQKAD